MTPEEMLGRLLYRDGLMLVIDKPAGFAVHRGPKGGESLEDHFDALRFGLPRAPALAHRLDRDTSGCLVLGRHRKALALLGKLFKQGKIGKTYWAVVEGAVDADAGQIDIALGKLDESRGWWMKPDPHGQPAVTTWKVMARGGGLTWLALEPLTGRTHQLRRDGLADIRRQHLRARAAHRRSAVASAFTRDRGADFQKQAAGRHHRAGAGAYA
jgi:tRNA pseudouridine32 synthase/23S rRNA pseudouridine746 synthase